MISRVLLRTGFRDMARRPLHTGLMVAGVALGVAVVVAIDLANESARRAFTRSSEAVAGRATHQVRGGPSGVPEDVLRRLRVDWGLRKSAPVVEGVVVAPDLDRRPLTVLGLDPLAEAPFRSFLTREASTTAGFSRLFEERNAVIVSRGLAERHRLALGAPFRIQVEDRFETGRVIGTMSEGPGGAESLDELLLMDVGKAQQLFRSEGWLSRIDLILSEDEAKHLRTELPAGLRLVAANENAEALAQLTSAFQLNLTALSLLALVVGMFLIFNTVTFSVVQRRTVLGTLRALGATPAQVFALIVLETAAAASLGAVLGLGLGFFLGQGALRLVSRTINDIYFVLAVADAPLTPGTAIKAMSLGIGAGVASALAPAFEAARVEPVAALRRSDHETKGRSRVPLVALAGLALGASGAAVLVFVPKSLAASFGGLFGVVLGLALMTPGATLLLMASATPVVSRLFGTLGRLAARTVARSIARTGVAVAALMVAVSVTIGVGLMIRSFRATVEDWLGLTLRADLYVSTASPGGSRRTSAISTDLAARVATVPGVADVETIRAVEVASPGAPVQLTVSDARHERSAKVYRFSEGSPAATWERVRAGAVLVSEPFAFHRELPPHGGTVTLDTDHGRHTFPVAGIYYDYAVGRGTVLIAREVYERFWDDRRISSLAVYVRSDSTAAEVADRVRRSLGGTPLRVVPTGALRREALRVFDRTFAVTESLRLLAVIVAVAGIWSALMALQTERMRELATLQALGLTPRCLAGLTLLESGLMGLAAGILSLPTGMLLALILVDVINVRSFGWTMRLVLEPSALVLAVLVSVSAALLASAYPLVRLRRMPLAAALRRE